MTVDSNGLLSFNSYFGRSQPAYGCRAWADLARGSSPPYSPGIAKSQGITSIGITVAEGYFVNFFSSWLEKTYSVHVSPIIPVGDYYSRILMFSGEKTLLGFYIKSVKTSFSASTTTVSTDASASFKPFPTVSSTTTWLNSPQSLPFSFAVFK